MISSAADYRFVDFQSGDLPTERFNGKIMPLRQNGGGSGSPEDMLKAEDIAFLHECVQDKIGAFSGISAEFPVPSSYTKTTTLVPTKKIIGTQMQGIHQRLASALARGIGNYGVGFLETPFTEYSNRFPQERGDNPFGQFIGFLNTVHGLATVPSSSQSDFARGAKVELAPVESLFTDARNLVMPMFRWLTPFIDENLESTLAEGSRLPSQNSGLGWMMVNDTLSPSLSGGAWRLVKRSSDALELASVPTDFLESADLWLAYCAYNGIWYDPGYVEDQHMSSINTWYYACGLIKLNASGGTGYAIRTISNNRIRFLTTAIQSKQLVDRIISDCGWEVHHVGSLNVVRQMISVRAAGDIFIVGTPNGRTKWWN